jgi:hypothetical protein
MLIVMQIQPINFSWGVSIWKALGEISSAFGGHLTYLNLSPRKEKGSDTYSLSVV